MKSADKYGLLLTVAHPFGGISREDRIEQDECGPYCDKAWHLPDKRKATVVLTCAFCGRKYARCAECNRGSRSAAVAMRAHVAGCRRRKTQLIPEKQGGETR